MSLGLWHRGHGFGWIPSGGAPWLACLAVWTLEGAQSWGLAELLHPTGGDE